MSGVSDVLVEKAARALHDAMCCDGDYPCKEPVEKPYTTLARAVLNAVAEQSTHMQAVTQALRDYDFLVWPCDNYTRPTTCLSAPSSAAARCNFCAEQAAAVRADFARIAREVGERDG